MSARGMRLSVALGVGMALASAHATAADIAFVGCPIVRDTRTVPCWLAEYDGETYYLGIQTDVSASFNPPSLGNRILVEGSVSDAPRICGGRVIDPVTVSIMEGRAEHCSRMLPSEDRYQLPFEPPRPPGPSRGRLAFDYAPPPPLPSPPFRPETFTLNYDFDGAVGFKHVRALTRVVEVAQHMKAGRIEIRGFRAATPLSNGTLLTEGAGIAERRARQMEQLLRGSQLDAPQYDVRWVDTPEPGGPDRRRVTITVIPPVTAN